MASSNEDGSLSSLSLTTSSGIAPGAPAIAGSSPAVTDSSSSTGTSASAGTFGPRREGEPDRGRRFHVVPEYRVHAPSPRSSGGFRRRSPEGHLRSVEMTKSGWNMPEYSRRDCVRPRSSQSTLRLATSVTLKRIESESMQCDQSFSSGVTTLERM